MLECDIFILLTTDYETIYKRNQTIDHILDSVWIDEERYLWKTTYHIVQREVIEKILKEIVGINSNKLVNKQILDTTNLSKIQVLKEIEKILEDKVK